MATTRLRRTFAYPTESDSDDPPDLDEEHQEELLTTLQTQDEATSTLYRHLFLALPVLTSLVYTPSLFTARTATATFIALLSIGVPGLAAYVLYFHPIKVPGRHGLRSLYVSSGQGGDSGGVKPRERHLIVLGASLAVMLFLQTALAWWAGKGEEDWREVVPAGEPSTYHYDGALTDTGIAVVYFLTLFVRQQLAPVDLEDLRKARYELKGA